MNSTLHYSDKTDMLDLIFITTFINKKAITGLLDSLLFNRNIRLGVVLVAQNNLEIDTSPYESDYTRLWTVTISGQLNSSKARNIGIEYIQKHQIKSKFVLFPDDDSSFDSRFFESFNQVADPDYCYLTDVYETGTKNYFQHIRVNPNRKIDRSYWNHVGAVNMLISYSVFLQVGMFDEDMGVGAKYGGGEDGDYFLRSLEAGAGYRYDARLYSYHPSGKNKYQNMSYKQILKRFKNYGIGVEYLLVKHKMYKAAIYICFKGLAATFLNLFTFQFKFASIYFYAFLIRSKYLTKFIFNQ